MSEQDILALEDRRFTAMTQGDFGALAALLHDDLLYTHSSGSTDSRASWLEAMKSGKTKYKSGVFSERKVRVFGDAALVTGKGEIQVEIGGQPRTLRLKYLNAWIKTSQGWKFVAWQSTPLPA